MMDFNKTDPQRFHTPFSQKPYTPRQPPRSVQGPRARVPLPLALRPAKPPSTASTMQGTLGLQSTIGSSSQFAVVPYQSHLYQPLVASDGLLTITAGLKDDVSLDGQTINQFDASKARYATFVHDMAKCAHRFVSPTLFAESLMHELDTRADTTPSMRVGAATWALDLLASTPGASEALLAVRNILLPAIYVHYNEFNLLDVAGAPRGLLRETDDQWVLQNPFLSHDIYAEHHLRREAENALSNNTTGRLAKLGASRKNVVTKLLDKSARRTVSVAFLSWRGVTRKKKFDRIARENRDHRRWESERSMVLQFAFSVWKSTVERSRSVFLSERLHNAAAQLENAKNQFQLQCFRSDKHLFTVEELRGEIAGLRKEMEEITEKYREAEKRLREHDITSANTLNEHIDTLVKELSAWRRFARRCVEGLSVHAETVRALKDQQKGLGEFLSNSDDDEDLNNKKDVSISGRKKKDVDKKEDKSAPAQTDAVVVPSTKSNDMSNNAEAILLAWVRSILSASSISPVATVTNFTTDFQSGEVMLIVLHHVFPADVPLNPLQETNVPKRLEKVIASFSKGGLAQIPRVQDFIECNSDVIFVVLAELFGRNLQLQSLKKAKDLMDSSYNGLEDPITSQVKYDVDMLPQVMGAAKDELQTLIGLEHSLREQSGTLLKWQETVGRESAFFTRERVSGNPVRAIGKSNVEKYWKFKFTRYQDLEQKYKLKDDIWKEHLTGTIRKLLQKFVHTTSRLFFRFAGNPVSMSEIAFWRLCTEHRFAEKPINNQIVEKIFAQVAKPVPFNADLHEGIENITLQEITPQDFVEILIRIADAKFAARFLPERVEMFLQAIHRSNATSSFRIAAPNFEKEFYSDAAQKIVERYLTDLARVFLFYGKRQQRSGGRLLSATLHTDNLFQLLDDVCALSTGASNPPGVAVGDALSQTMSSNQAPGFVSHNEVRTFVRCIAIQEDGTPSAELLFHQFLEVLACLAMFRTPDPLVPMEKKLEVLLSTVIARARAKNKGSGLVLSDVKIVAVA